MNILIRFLSICSIVLAICMPVSSNNNLFDKKTNTLNSVQKLEDFNNAVSLSIIKDSKGFMWISTQYGLIRYNGYEYKTYAYDPGADNTIPNLFSPSVLLESRDGKIWIGTSQNLLIEFNLQTQSFSSYPLDKKSDNLRNWISTMYEDKKGNIWLGLQYEGFYRFDPTDKAFKLFRQQKKEVIAEVDFVTKFIEIDDDHLLVATWQGLYVLNMQSDSINTFEEFTGLKLPKGFENARFNSFIKDKNGNTWVGSEKGLFVIDSDLNSIEITNENDDQLLLKGDYVIDIFENPIDKGHSLWVVTYPLNLNRIDLSTYHVERYKSPKNIPANVYSRYLDDSAILWLASENQGVFYIDLKKNPFEHFEIVTDELEIKKFSGTAFYKDNHNSFWIGTGTGGIFRYNSSGKFAERFAEIPGSLYNFPTLVYSFLEDSHNNLWISFWADGLCRYDYSKREFERYHFKYPLADIPYSGSSEIVEDQFGRIWVGTTNGVYYYDLTENDSIHFTWVDVPLLRDYLIRSLCKDHEGTMWFTTQHNGLYSLAVRDRDSMDFIRYTHDPTESASISSNCIYSVHSSSTGELWVGTNTGLNRFDYKTGSFELFNPNNGFESYFVFCIRTDKSDNVWAITEKGLVRFNPDAEEGRKFKLFSKNDGLPFTDIYPYHFDIDEEGYIYVGGLRGFGMGYFTFHPDSIIDNERIPPVAITSLKIRNQEFPIDSGISYKKYLSLDYNQNFLSFEFAALDYNDPKFNQHAYMLEGVDNEWVYCGSRRFANYTALQAGNYTFRVKGSNNDGYWNEQGAEITFTIAAPPWKTWWAYSLYLLLIIGIFAFSIRYYLRRQKLLHLLEMEHIETEKLIELDSLKSKFFANISHEFRTPLTLILGPLNKLLEKSHKKDEKKELSVIKRNALRLQQLISQLLDLSKLESGKMELQCSEVNIIEWVRMYIQSFESLARQKGIEFIFQSEIDEIRCWFDPEKMATILNNLLSNAFKFTRSGEIRVHIATSFPKLDGSQRGVIITITDTGQGIPKDKLQNIFNRFYQSDDSNSRRYEGTGIGLAIVKELVELHHGSITVESKLNTGTTFRVLIPLSKNHHNNDEAILARTERITADIPFQLTEENYHSKEFQKNDKANEPMLLIVEDNADMRNYIRGYFNNSYSIIEAINGEKGFHSAVRYIPDIVISDVMMPVMDGYQLSKKLRSDERTSHIPVVLLTARSSGADKIEGLETGADDFVIKPFDGTELQVRIKNLITQRKKLREHFKKEFSKSDPLYTTAYPSLDQQFLNKALRIIELNLSNPDFSVEEFAREMAMSRVQLHRKMKAITDLSAGDFIRTFRLRKAAEMLSSKSGNITEIAYAVGYNNPSWFAEQFKKQFGVIPSKYDKKPSM